MGVTTYPEGAWPDHWFGIAGTWRGGKTVNGRTALFCCPTCGKIASLSDYTIAEDGTVTPSLVCPTEGCTFHEFIRLEGWKPTTQKPPVISRPNEKTSHYMDVCEERNECR